MKWIACFSQTGREIAELSKKLGRWPDEIYTDNFNEDQWKSNIPIEQISSIITPKAFNSGLKFTLERCFITLHGWLNIIPADICEMHDIYNGHPGAINLYPELKGRDPQEKVWNNKEKYTIIGSVVHKVISEVDSGEIVSNSLFRLPFDYTITKDELYEVLRETSLEAWTNFLMDKINITPKKDNTVRPNHYKGEGMYECIDVIKDLCNISDNDRFTDYNRFQAFKYVWRAGNKGPVLQDLKKAITFLQFAVDYEEKKNDE